MSRSSFMLTLVLLAGAALPVGGCATYVNIPHQPGDVARNNPNIATVQQVSVAAARAVLAQYPIEGDFLLALPEGTSAETYDAVVLKVHERARWSEVPVPNVPVLDVRQVRVRGTGAEVDVIKPGGYSLPAQLVTVYLDWDPVSGWHPARMRLWRAPVEQALAASRGEGEIPAVP